MQNPKGNKQNLSRQKFSKSNLKYQIFVKNWFFSRNGGFHQKRPFSLTQWFLWKPLSDLSQIQCHKRLICSKIIQIKIFEFTCKFTQQLTFFIAKPCVSEALPWSADLVLVFRLETTNLYETWHKNISHIGDNFRIN